jgi:hypothetical protein
MKATAEQTGIGNQVWDLAQKYSSRINESELATSCRNLTLPKERYFGYVAAMYPIVVGFNRALIRSIAKVDHVRQYQLVKYLSEQLREEQMHNSLWRSKMDKYGIDHEKLYTDLETYLAQFSDEELDSMTEQVIAALREDVTNVSPGIFPDPVVPEPVLALYHHLYQSATDPDVDYWEHFACQSAVEYIIFDVVSTSVYPGVSAREDLNLGAATVRWWEEHARQGSEISGKRSDEEKHLEMSKIALNRTPRPNEIADRILARAEDAMCLFAGSAICHDADKTVFSVRPYLKAS